MKRLLIIAFVLVHAILLLAQNADANLHMEITSFRALQKDMDARIQAPVTDQNGEKCALIKVVTTALGAKFESPALGITKKEVTSNGEVWLYVPAGSRSISIFHEGCTPIRNYAYPVRIESATVYEMTLSSNIIEDPNADIIYDENSFATASFTVQPANAQIVLRKLPEATDNQGTLSKRMPLGKYHYSVSADNHFRYDGVVELREKDTNVPVNVYLQMHKGNINVSTTPAGASVFVDGKEIGKTPLSELYETNVGQHKVKVALNGYRTEEQGVNVTYNATSNASFTLRDSASYKFVTIPSGANLWVDGKEIGKTPCTFEGTTTEYDIMATHSKYKDYHQKMQLKASDPNVSIRLQRIYQYKNTCYAQIGLQAGSLMAVTATVGGYFNNINVEASYLLCMGKSETIFWNYPSGSYKEPEQCEYKPSAFGGKVGYGITVNPRIRITPQLGATIINIKDSGDASKGNATSMSVGGRVDYALMDNIGLYIAPEMDVAVTKSDVFKKVAAVSSKIKGWADGFNCRLGVCVFF